MWDVENRRYLDFTAGIAVTSLGHAEPEISKQLYQQVGPQSTRSYETGLNLACAGQHDYTHFQPLP
jgi:4-aminobutyrate aminotransferase-like enzyme